MSRSKRRLYVVLHVLRSICQGMLQTDAEAKEARDTEARLASKSVQSIKRILARVEAEMDALGTLDASDNRYMIEVGDKLRAAWSDDEQLTRPTFISVALAMVVEHKDRLPHNATQARAMYDALEGMLSTLYNHFDPDLSALPDMNHGEALAHEFVQVAFAA
ncbi:hypothetical protein [Desulfovibrio psychrotolerans]|uniref:Uncharacterized protein n=1 Tax=Desulfovibrio psychrotolerans TaxID=415242 RepID=A0A7J0BX45_9BACT|nr:hypothetical protein [Desulfovibrio psychrotolerans]GFM38280.1 hypothetical protein DSM19430T_29640 [Desulfovibrio psychrotolerans]